MPEYLSFEEVVKQLDLSEDELKGLVSEGELRAFRDEDKMKFRKDDVEALAKTLYESPGIVLPGQGGPPPGDRGGGTILDLDAEQAPAESDTSVPTIDFGDSGELEPAVELDSTADPGAFEETSLPTEAADEGADTGPIANAPIDTTGVPEADFGGSDATIVEPPSEEGDTTGVTQEMVFEESDLKVQPGEESSSLGASEADETFTDDSSKMAAAEEGLTADAEGAEAAAVEEEEAAPEARSGPRAPRASGPAVPGHHPVMTVCLFVCSATLWVLGYLLVDLVRVTIGTDPCGPAPVCRRVLDMVAGKTDKSAK